MSKLNESATPSSKRNPLIWIALLVIGLILYIVLSVDRERAVPPIDEVAEDSSGEIDRSLLIPPGMRARQAIEQTKEDGEPYSLDNLFEQAERHFREGNLADAHLLFFFSAREGHLEAIMKMAEMADPTLFKSEDSLLDQADAIQAYKWYQKASRQGMQKADDRIESLKQWAMTESRLGNSNARQLLLTIN